MSDNMSLIDKELGKIKDCNGAPHDLWSFLDEEWDGMGPYDRESPQGLIEDLINKYNHKDQLELQMRREVEEICKTKGYEIRLFDGKLMLVDSNHYYSDTYFDSWPELYTKLKELTRE